MKRVPSLNSDYSNVDNLIIEQIMPMYHLFNDFQ